MKTLSIDIETYSSVDLKSAGVYRYVEAADFDILLFAYKMGDAPVEVVDLARGEAIPEGAFNALFDPDTLKTAYNANFEIVCLNKWLSRQGRRLDPAQWEDTMFRAAYAGYCGSLKSVAEMMGFGEDKQKDKAGAFLINKFSKPRRPTKSDSRRRVAPMDEPDAWESFKAYNKQDVEVEAAIQRTLSEIEIPEAERRAWLLDHRMQARGLGVDMALVRAALDLDAREKARVGGALKEITGVSNPKSGAQMKEWLSGQLGREVKSLTKETVPALIKECREAGLSHAADALELRQELMKTSLAKYAKLSEMACSDGRIHGILQFYGTKTGRWAGRGVQVQNLPRNSLPAIGTARDLLKSEDWEALAAIYGPNLSDVASQLIRTAFVPAGGKKFAIADYSAIEARVIAWLSGEEWRLEVFRTTGKIYEASAAQMFNADFERICDKSAPEHKLRAQGKVAELALGYQGGVNALARMDYAGAIPEGDRKRIVGQWREKNPKIVALWDESERAAKEALESPGREFTAAGGKVSFTFSGGAMRVGLPSGRVLFYPGARMGENKYGHFCLSYTGVSQTTKKVGSVELYGGKIVENIVQAVARDCLSEALERLEAAGFDIKFHVHDEVILEVDAEEAEALLDKAIEIMCQPPRWAEGIPLRAEGFTGDFYMKD